MIWSLALHLSISLPDHLEYILKIYSDRSSYHFSFDKLFFPNFKFTIANHRSSQLTTSLSFYVYVFESHCIDK